MPVIEHDEVTAARIRRLVARYADIGDLRDLVAVMRLRRRIALDNGLDPEGPLVAKLAEKWKYSRS